MYSLIYHVICEYVVIVKEVSLLYYAVLKWIALARREYMEKSSMGMVWSLCDLMCVIVCVMCIM